MILKGEKDVFALILLQRLCGGEHGVHAVRNAAGGLQRGGKAAAAQRFEKDFRFLSGFPLSLTVGDQPLADDAAAQLAPAAPESIGVDGKLGGLFPALQLQGDRDPVDVQIFVLKIVGQPDAVPAAVGQKLAVVPGSGQNGLFLWLTM